MSSVGHVNLAPLPPLANVLTLSYHGRAIRIPKHLLLKLAGNFGSAPSCCPFSYFFFMCISHHAGTSCAQIIMCGDNFSLDSFFRTILDSSLPWNFSRSPRILEAIHFDRVSVPRCWTSFSCWTVKPCCVRPHSVFLTTYNLSVFKNTNTKLYLGWMLPVRILSIVSFDYTTLAVNHVW